MKKLIAAILLVSGISTVYSQKDAILMVNPLEKTAIVGGRETFLPRIFKVENGEKSREKLEIKEIRYEFDGKEIYASKAKPFYIKYDFSFIKNGSYPFKVEVKDEKGGQHVFFTNIIVSNVNVIVRAKLKTPIPPGRQLFIAGNPTVLSPVEDEWEAKGKEFKQVNKDTYEVSFQAGLNSRLVFEVNLGSWALKGRDPKNNVIHPTVKITEPNQVIEIEVDNWGVLQGHISGTGYVIGWMGDPSELIFSHTHKDDSPTTMAWRYEQGDFQTMQTTKTQFSHFIIPFKQGKKLEFTFTPFKETNTFQVPALSYPFQFIAVGDIRISGSSKIPGLIAKEKDTSFIVDTGDIVFSGLNATDWTSFFKIFKPLISQFIYQPAIGNHEEETPLYQPVLGRPFWYYFTWGNSLFINLNDNSPFQPGSEQYQWLTNTLEKTKNYKFKFVSFHVPIYTSRVKGLNEDGIKYLVPLFEKYKIDVVFNGDDHGYEATYPMLQGKKSDKGGVIYIVTAGGGAPLYDMTRNEPWSRFNKKAFHYMRVKVWEDHVILEAVEDNKKVFDTIEIKK